MQNENQMLLAEITDLLNQALIKLAAVNGDSLPTTENYNYQEVWDEDSPDYNHELATLVDMKNILTRLVSDPSNAIYNEQQYNTSNC